MIDFHDVVFPEGISYGSSGGPCFNTTIIEMATGFEQRNVNWSEAKAKYEVSHGVKTRGQMEELLDFFYARSGRAYGFLFKDWADYQFEWTWTSDGTDGNIPCFKAYEAGTAFAYNRRIRKLKPGTMQLFKDDDLVIDEAAEYDVSRNHFWFDHADGAFAIHPDYNPGEDVVWTVRGEFYVPVRFDSDDMSISHDGWETMSWPSIPLTEVRKFTSAPTAYVTKTPLADEPDDIGPCPTPAVDYWRIESSGGSTYTPPTAVGFYDPASVAPFEASYKALALATGTSEADAQATLTMIHDAYVGYGTEDLRGILPAYFGQYGALPYSNEQMDAAAAYAATASAEEVFTATYLLTVFQYMTFLQPAAPSAKATLIAELDHYADLPGTLRARTCTDYNGRTTGSNLPIPNDGRWSPSDYEWEVRGYAAQNGGWWISDPAYASADYGQTETLGAFLNADTGLPATSGRYPFTAQYKSPVPILVGGYWLPTDGQSSLGSWLAHFSTPGGEGTYQIGQLRPLYGDLPLYAIEAHYTCNAMGDPNVNEMIYSWMYIQEMVFATKRGIPDRVRITFRKASDKSIVSSAEWDTFKCAEFSDGYEAYCVRKVVANPCYYYGGFDNPVEEGPYADPTAGQWEIFPDGLSGQTKVYIEVEAI